MNYLVLLAVACIAIVNVSIAFPQEELTQSSVANLKDAVSSIQRQITFLQKTEPYLQAMFVYLQDNVTALQNKVAPQQDEAAYLQLMVTNLQVSTVLENEFIQTAENHIARLETFDPLLLDMVTNTHQVALLKDTLAALKVKAAPLQLKVANLQVELARLVYRDTPLQDLIFTLEDFNLPILKNTMI